MASPSRAPSNRSDRSDRSDRGAVTVEAALALGSLAVVTTLAVGALTAVGASIRCTDAARELARLAARGEPDRGRAVATRLAPRDAQITLTIRGDEATAEARAQRTAVLITAPLGLCFLPAFLVLGIAPVVIGLAADALTWW